MPNAYLTIDDSPSTQTHALVDFLKDRDIPAILFVRGDRLEQNPRAIEYAIKNGLIIGNHSYAHKPAGEMEPQGWADDLELCEHLIEAAYARCDIIRPAKYYRFPYIDRGDGQKIEQIDKAAITENDKTNVLQEYLQDQCFSQPFQNMPLSYPSHAADCLYSYTSRDWMLTQRHRGKHDYKTLEDLKSKIDTDEALKNDTVNHVLLMHDQSDIFQESCALIAHFQGNGFTFLDILA